jgi:hypothetical protein
MKYSKWVGLFAVLMLILSATQPWVYIPAKNLTITGIQTAGTNFGKPALMNIIVSGIAALLFLSPRIMAKRANVFFCTFNIAWAIRNFIILSICRAGECPEKRAALYLLLISGFIMLIASLFPDVELKNDAED